MRYTLCCREIYGREIHSVYPVLSRDPQDTPGTAFSLFRCVSAPTRVCVSRISFHRSHGRCGPSGQGLDLSDPLANAFCGDVARLYVRMLPTAPGTLSSPTGGVSKPWPAGGESAMSVLGALLGANGAVSNGSPVGEGLPEGGKVLAPTPLNVDEIEEAVVDEVMKVSARPWGVTRWFTIDDQQAPCVFMCLCLCSCLCFTGVQIMNNSIVRFFTCV